ncbi:uridine phosphorylase [Dictyostelium discoideum AX4]|uniref:Uridine phosphorylase n=1 Tax=Dictyostelium discoideum TaxID=44689 RepID=Q54UM3_DICDI|nr:uridine phosphorylase [Dictyostelium discoideum AX4]EAL66789.1 uridine phosphorylase [Dictyostelium discoideum AX4]|eukprot:XP_640753.1 uridine phosphorylase [Dictyostelium discoideum AX4]
MTEVKKLGDAKNANFPVDERNAVYHLGVAKGELSQRILTVGDSERASRLTKELLEEVEEEKAHRGFVIHTGKYKGVRVSIVSIGMGTPMMDFLVREGRFVVDGPMAIIRYGTCGSIKDVEVGSLAIAESSILIRRNPDFWHSDNNKDQTKCKPYDISKPVAGDKELIDLLKNDFESIFKDRKTVVGINASADSFYSSQGRIDPEFDDFNEQLIENIIDLYENKVNTLEMETFQLYHLATRSKQPIKAASSTIILANRVTQAFLDNNTKVKLEIEGGRACLESLIKVNLN